MPPVRSISPPSQPPVSCDGHNNQIGVQLGHCLVYAGIVSHQAGTGTLMPGSCSIMRVVPGAAEVAQSAQETNGSEHQ